MTTRQVIKRIIKDSGKTQKEVAEELGYKTSNFNMKLMTKDSMKIGFVLKILDILDYDVLVRSRRNYDKEYELVCEEDYVPTITDSEDIDVSTGIIKETGAGRILKEEDIEFIVKTILERLKENN